MRHKHSHAIATKHKADRTDCPRLSHNQSILSLTQKKEDNTGGEDEDDDDVTLKEKKKAEKKQNSKRATLPETHTNATKA